MASIAIKFANAALLVSDVCMYIIFASVKTADRRFKIVQCGFSSGGNGEN